MATPEFTIPNKPEELAHEDCTYDVRVTHLKDLSQLSAEGVREFAQRVLSELCNELAQSIIETSLFNHVYSLVNAFACLDSVSRKRLIDSLCSNQSVLGVSINSLLLSDDGEDEPASAHGSAFKAYTFLLWWTCAQGEQEQRETQPAAPAMSGSNGASRGRKKAVGHGLAQWDWDAQREKILRCLGTSTEVDLWKLFRPKDPDSRLLQKWLQTANLVLESNNAVKNKCVKEAAFRMLSIMALKYQQLDVVSGAMVDLMNKHEHLPSVLAELAEFSAQQNSDPRLGVEMLREVASVDPHDYDQQQKDDAGGIRNVSTFVQELAERLPKTVAAHVSLLIPHLGGKAYPLRSAIVVTVGHLVQCAYADPPEEEADAQGAVARLRSKQHLLDTLVERARDQSAFTRARVMQTWASLAASRSIDMGHWLCVTELAIGRLEDKTAHVRKHALLLLSSLLSFNPFAPQLPEDKFVATLEEYQRKLQELQPDEGEQEAAGMDTITEETRIDSAEPIAEGEEPHKASTAEDMYTTDVQADQPAEGPNAPSSVGGRAVSGEVTKLRATVACMDAAVGFIRALRGALGTLTQLLASANLSDVTEAISLLICYDKFCINGSEEALRQMLPLIFSREQGVKDAVLGAIDELFIGDLEPTEAAQRLITLADGSSIGELSSLEEVVSQMLAHQPPLLKPPVLNAIWQLCEQAHRSPQSEEAARNVRCSLALLSMAAAKQPTVISARLDLLLKVGFSEHQMDALVVRHACIALQSLAQMQAAPAAERLRAASASLVSVLVGSPLAELGWYSAAEAALKAIYALHPAPAVLASAVLRKLAASVFGRDAGNNGPASSSADALSHFFFVLGHIALLQLVHVEKLASMVRKKRMAAEKHAAEVHAERHASGESGALAEEDDIAAQVGVGSAAADSELDALKEAAEAQITTIHNLIGQFAPLVARFCHNRALMAAHYNLRTSALLALTKLMALDPAFCDCNLQLVFTLLQTRIVEPSIRSNLVIAVGDLAFRFPNLLEPWTHNMYLPLSDPDKSVVKNSLMVLSHLVLNDMMKVKGHIARLALCLQDDEPRIAALAQLFFHELSLKAYKGTNPVYNLLPDILSNLSSEPGLSQKGFQDIMRHLLQYIGKEKHADSLVDKLCARFESTEELTQWRNLAFCITQLNYTEKGLRKMAELLKAYQPALYDDEVLESFKAVIAKAKKMPKAMPEFKSEMEAFEEKLLATATERREERATAEAARNQQNPSSNMDASHAIVEEETVTQGMQEDREMQADDAEQSETMHFQAARAPPDAEPALEASSAEMPPETADDSPIADPGPEDNTEPETSSAKAASSGAAPALHVGLEEQLESLALDAPESSGSGRGASQVQKADAARSENKLRHKTTGRKSRGSTATRISTADADMDIDAAGARHRSARLTSRSPAEHRNLADENLDTANKPRAPRSSASKAAAAGYIKTEPEVLQQPPQTGVKAMRSLWEQRAVPQPEPARRKGRSNAN